MSTIFKKIIKYGWSNFYRHSVLSFATIFILVLTLLFVSAFFVLQHSTDFLISRLEERVDMSVFLQQDLPEQDVLFLKKGIAELPGVISVEYISADLALEKFVERFEYSPAIMEALDIVPFNPLLSSFAVRAENPAQYEKIAYFLGAPDFDKYIERIDFDPETRQLLINRLFAITTNIRIGGIIFILILAFIVILASFNTISLAIYNTKDEVTTMKLVGASSMFIKGPFIIQGILTGFFSAFIAIIISGFLIFFLNSEIMLFTGGLNLWRYFLRYFSLIFVVQLIVGVGLGVISSLIAVRKYLKV